MKNDNGVCHLQKICLIAVTFGCLIMIAVSIKTNLLFDKEMKKVTDKWLLDNKKEGEK